ncbi:MAG: flagellar M-ring protein FliF C-terminal domain-containing protein [Fidelibacterota bacterium]
MRKVNIYCRSFILAIFCLSVSWGQNNNYLAQKLMVENDLRQRITDALSKIIDDRKYVIDVKADIEISDGTEEQITIMGEGKQPPSGQVLEDVSSDLQQSLEKPSSDRSSGISSGLPIPGFEFESDGGDAYAAETGTEPEMLTQSTPSLSSSQKSNILSRTVTSRRPSKAIITKLDISIILQEGAAPELIENIRQVVMVSSGFNRARGDALSIMTATFKERRDEKTAEQILLKNIAEKLESLEQQQSGDGSVHWKDELDSYKAQEEERREQDKLYFQQQLTNLESEARNRAYQTEKREMLRRDSLKLIELNKEINDLKSMMASSDVSVDEVGQAQNAIGEKISEKESLDVKIAEKLAMLDAVQSDLDRSMGGGPSTMMVVFVSLLGALVIVLVVALIIIMMGNKQKQQLPPPWMYPPRPRKKKSKNKPVTPITQPAPSAPAPRPVEDTAVLQSEVSDMKQAVVSMSVGQPGTATRIVKEWMEDDVPPPEPEPAAPVEAEEEDSGKKKKKKKKK